jgi:hypothetical protein
MVPPTIPTEYLAIHPSGREDRFSARLPAEPTYQQLVSVISPHFPNAEFEHVYVLWDDKPLDMFVDEQGQRKQLPLNPRATKIYRNNWMTQHPDADPESLPTVVGLALLFSRRIWN